MENIKEGFYKQAKLSGAINLPKMISRGNPKLEGVVSKILAKHKGKSTFNQAVRNVDRVVKKARGKKPTI